MSGAFGIAGSAWASGHHTGQDLGAPEGTPVLAAANGTVVFAGPGGRYGNLTEIAHSDGVQTWYAHQSKLQTSVGSVVRAGQQIGLVGQTGNAFGAHLHFELRVGGQPVDPMPWLSGAPAVAGSGPPLETVDPARAAQLRADLADAEATHEQAEAQANRLRTQAAEVTKQAEQAATAAAVARQAVAGYIRAVYKAGGMDPQWLLQADALTAGDPADYSDRQVYLQYSNDAQARLLTAALAAETKAAALRDQVKTLLTQADVAVQAAATKMAAIQTQLDAASWSWAAVGQWDGVIPPGGSPQSLRAVQFALSQLGHAYVLGATGPDYDCSGYVWRAWREAGLKWTRTTAQDQATDRRWVVPVSAEQLAPGDLVFFRFGNGTDPRPGAIDHVGIVINPAAGAFAHASSPRTGVELNNFRTSGYYSRSIAMFGRVLDGSTGVGRPQRRPQR